VRGALGSCLDALPRAAALAASPAALLSAGAADFALGVQRVRQSSLPPRKPPQASRPSQKRPCPTFGLGNIE